MPDENYNALYEAAGALIKQRYAPRKHVIAAAVMGASGKIYTAVNLDCHLRRAAVCGEGAAIAAAMTAGEKNITAVLALRHDPGQQKDLWVVSPCGVCRELIMDYGPGAAVYMPDQQNGAHALSSEELLPNRYAK